MASAHTQPDAALDDLLVLELGDLGTQYTGQLLGDMGARVLKIEPPEGAGCRHRGPFKDDKPDVNGSLYFWAYNTNKESITLDLAADADRRKLKRLARKADILLEDYRPGFLVSLGLGYEDLSRKNPGLVMTSITPFGQTGPLKDWKGSDLVYWAMGGIMAGGGYEDPGSPPLAPQGDLAYLTAGHWALMGTLLALTGRDATGDGQHVDLSIHEACAFVNRNDIAEVTEVGGQFDARLEPARRGGGIGTVRCKDGKYFIPQLTFTLPAQWLRLVQWFKQEGVGQQMWNLDLPALEELAKGQAPMAPPPLPGLMEALEGVASRKNADEICPAGQEMGFTWMVYNAPDELMGDEQLNHRKFFQEVYHPEHGKAFTYPGEPYKFSKAGWKIRRRPPLLGEHNAVLESLIGG
jgi:benzylsuccinate CoA-transferase BbsE subunit